MTVEKLHELLIKGCTGGFTAIRLVTKLQPAGGAGDKIFPATYEGGAYATEKRVIGGEAVDCVLVDSVQSQANRLEDLLLEAFRSGRLALPVFEVDLKLPGHDTITSLTAPHRVHDAILRDSLWNGIPFRESENGKRLVSARAWNATAFFEYAPTALLFGTWDSQSGGGTNTAKIARSLVSEIIAIGAVPGVRTASRLDPLGIKLVKDVISRTDGPEMWRFVEPGGEAKKSKKGEGKLVRPSEINHGNVTPTITAAGFTCREAVQTTVLSLTQIRKLKFPTGVSLTSLERDVAGRAVIAALGLFAVTLQHEDGYQLRSRCQLVPSKEPLFEFLGRTAEEKEEFSIDSAVARGALSTLLDSAKQTGLCWNGERISLEPRPDLVKLVAHSDAMTGGAEAE